jgi:arylsulfatase A-like enzyme
VAGLLDDAIARFLAWLEEQGWLAETLVVVTSDHGEEFQEHGSWEHQKTLYEEVIRVPLVVRGPGVPARRETAQVSLLDVAPTVLGWTGLPAWSHAQGRSLLVSPGNREAYGETDHTIDGSYKLFWRLGQGRWKAIVSLGRDDRSPRRTEWYDLAADPAETRSASPPADLAESLRRRAIDRWLSGRREGGPAPPVSLTSEQGDRLRSLGYVGP